jgi:hypothetical protein
MNLGPKSRPRYPAGADHSGGVVRGAAVPADACRSRASISSESSSESSRALSWRALGCELRRAGCPARSGLFALLFALVPVACLNAGRTNRSATVPSASGSASAAVPVRATEVPALAKAPLKGTVCFIDSTTTRVQDVSDCRPVGVLYASHLNVSPQTFEGIWPGIGTRPEWFSMDFRGTFRVRTPGTYAFRLLSDDGSLLWINGDLIIDNDGLHTALSKTGTTELGAGRHRIRVLYFQGPGPGVALQLLVTPPGQPEQLWTGEL